MLLPVQAVLYLNMMLFVSKYSACTRVLFFWIPISDILNLFNTRSGARSALIRAGVARPRLEKGCPEDFARWRIARPRQSFLNGRALKKPSEDCLNRKVAL